MIRNLFLAALVAALCAGLATSVFQAWRVTPLIFAAETYEVEEASAEAPAATSAEHAAAGHDASDWAPQDGLERTIYTVAANMLLAAGFAFILGAVSTLFNIPITAANAVYWGMAGFAAFSLAPALGLPPGMPGMPVAPTLARQIWWAGAALSTGAGLLLVAKLRAGWTFAVALGLILLPQLIPAPQPPSDPTGVPARLALQFVAAVLFNGALFWIVLGLVFGHVADYLAARPATRNATVKA